jgi:hypothetical protein
MAIQTIDLGTLGGADGTGDSIRTAGIKINSNFTELYANPLASVQIGLLGNNISTTQSNADLVFEPAGTGAIVFPGITIDDNNIRVSRTNDDLVIRPNGTGSVVIDALSFSGTSIRSEDSSNININEDLTVDGTLLVQDSLTVSGATTSQSTMDVTGNTSLSSLTVSGASSFVGTTTIDNLTFNDNIITTSSNADLRLTPGGTGVVKVSNLTIDSNINFTDNVIRVTNSDSDLALSASGSGVVRISRIDLDQGTADNTIIGGNAPATGTFSSLAFHTASTATLSTAGITITDNKITTTRSNESLSLNASGVGNVVIDGFRLPNTDGHGGQLLKTNGSKTLTWGNTPSFVVSNTDVQDATATVLGSSSATQVIDSWSASTYRSVKYHVQISDATADRYSLVEANVTHDGSTAYISIFGRSGNGTGDGSTAYESLELSVDVSGGNVRLLGRVNNTNNQVVKLVKRVIKV